MATQVFINLPVKDLERSKSFFTALGFSFNPKFTDETAACLVISDTIFAMLITPKRFQDFTPKIMVDAHAATEVLNALSFASRERVDEIANAALLAGATQLRPADELGFMYSRSINDLDGHIWEFFWMDPTHVQ